MKKLILIGLILLTTSCVKGQDSKKNDLISLDSKSDSISNKLSLLFIGDFMGHKDQINAAYNKVTKTHDYYESFMYMQQTMCTPDVTIGNLEVILGVKPYSGYPQFSSPIEYGQCIKDAGVDILATSNNHSCDKRRKGVEKTIKVLDSLGIRHTGTYISADEKVKQNPFIINKNGLKIALINYTYGTNGIKPTAPNIVNYLNEESIKSDIEIAKSANVDGIIAFVHWGREYKDLPGPNQKKWFHFFKDNGVNIVVGSHPHVVEPMKHDKENGTFVAYSLGNFVSHQRTHPRDGGAVLKLNLIKKEGKVSVDKAGYKLTWVYEPIKLGKKKYYVLPVSDFENYPEFFPKKKDYNKMMRYAKHARRLFAKENLNVEEYK